MQTYDFLMLLVLAGMTLFGFAKGLAWQLAYIASLTLSYFLALRFSTQLAPVFGDTAPWNRFVAMLAIYVGSSLAIWVIFRGVSGFIDRVKLKEFDRQMGALVGFGRGVLWCVAITFFAVTLLEGQRDQILRSQSGHYIALLLDKTHSVVPGEIHAVVGPYLDRARTEIDPDRAEPLPGELDGSGSGIPSVPEWPANASGSPSGIPSGLPGGSAPPPWNTDAPSRAPPAWPNSGTASQPPAWPNDNRVPAQPASGTGGNW